MVRRNDTSHGDVLRVLKKRNPRAFWVSSGKSRLDVEDLVDVLILDHIRNMDEFSGIVLHFLPFEGGLLGVVLVIREEILNDVGEEPRRYLVLFSEKSDDLEEFLFDIVPERSG